MEIIYDKKQDFHAKMQKFGAKVKQQTTNTSIPPNYNSIADNIQSIQSKLKFGRLVCYSTNCLANISQNKFNCDAIVEKGGIETMKQIINYHNSNPAIMKEVARIITNISNANPIYADKINNDGLLQQCMNTLQENAKETGIFAINIMQSVLKYSQNPKYIAQQIMKNNGLKILTSLLQENTNNPDLWASVITFMNALMTVDPSITTQFGNIAMWNSVMNAMKVHPEHGYIAIAGTEFLTKLALSNSNYSSAICKVGGVNVISTCMQYNPDLKELIDCGAVALKLLGNKDDISRSLTVLLDFGKYDNIIITQALGLLGNLALIQENAQFIVAKGGLNCLMNLINYKCKQKDLSCEEINVIANSIRAMGRLLNNDKNTTLFINKGGVELLNDILIAYDDKENIINAAIDALSNLIGNCNTGLGSILSTTTNLICKHPEYNVLMQKYCDILCQLSLNDEQLLNSVINAGLLQCIQQSLSMNINSNDPETLKSIMDVIKQIVTANPTLTQQIVNENASNIIKVIQRYPNHHVLLQKILDAVYTVGTVDENALNYLNKIGFNNVLSQILKQETISDETVSVIKAFIDKIQSANIAGDLSSIFTSLKALGMDSNTISTLIQETEVKYDSSEEPIQYTVESASITYDISPIVEQNKSNILNGTLEMIAPPPPFTTYDTQTLMTKLRESKDPPIMIGTVIETIANRLQGGDTEIFNAIITGGGLGLLLHQTNNNMGTAKVVNGTLDSVGILSTNNQLKQLLGMYGTIRLILQIMRTHSNDIEVLDKCCYILSNLSFNNETNMTEIIELGGVQDIVGVIVKHNTVNFLCESAINVLVNLCHNSDKNKVLIARSGGAKATVNALTLHNYCKNDGDEALVISCFKCLGNLAYINDNVKQLINLDVVAHVIDTMNKNSDKKELIEMAVIVLANLSSHEKTAIRMVNLGVLDLIIKVSEMYPNEMEIQRSCLGCIGNLMNEQSNVIEFIDKKGHLRVFEIMQELVFEESVVITALKLLKILATDSNVATELCMDGGCKIIAEIMEENKGSEEILSLGCQAMCKMIVTVEAATHIAKDGICDIIIDIAKDNHNWANIKIMNELVKVIVNMSSVEDNAKILAMNGCVPLLRSIEAHKTNAVFLNNAAMALTKMSVYPSSSRSLVKRGAVAVILASMQLNPTRKAILARYVRTLTNFSYTEHKTSEELVKHNGHGIVKQLAQKYANYQPLQKEVTSFEKVTKHWSSFNYKKRNKSIRDKLDVSTVRFLYSGTLVKKYGNNGKTKKRILRVNDDCSLLLVEDPKAQKLPKQLNMRSVTSVVDGVQVNCIANSFVVIAMDPNGKEFRMTLECKTYIETKRWVDGLQNIIQVITSNNGHNNNSIQ